MSYLLDTCAVSEYVQKSPSVKVTQWLDGLEKGAAYLSVITIGEIRQGISRLTASKRREGFEEWLTDRLIPRFEGQILPVDVPVMMLWGDLVAELSRKGRVLPAFDSLIVAQARHHGLKVVTRNVKNFKGTGVTVVSPWEGGEKNGEAR